ncbi:helix-turn-helix transcriptional regulator [Lacinutrix sp.]|uniref:helix-turn-helix domain-containing protein n=1 Tax=Lacinutrix sp. TaxID=1937692 RepID=UPI0030961A66
MNTNYSIRIKKILQDKNLSVLDFCKFIGLNSPGTIHKLIQDNRKPSTKTVDRILGAFPEYTKDWLLYGVEAKEEVHSDDLTVTAQQVISYFEKKQKEIENKFYEQGVSALHTLTNKVDDEARIVKDMGDHVNYNLNNVQDRLTLMEGYVILLEKDAQKFVKEMEGLKFKLNN